MAENSDSEDDNFSEITSISRQYSPNKNKERQVNKAGEYDIDINKVDGILDILHIHCSLLLTTLCFSVFIQETLSYIQNYSDTRMKLLLIIQFDIFNLKKKPLQIV